MIRSMLRAGAAVLVLVPVVAGAEVALPRGLAALSSADFAARTQVVDDPLEQAVVLTTASAYKRGQAMDGAFATDVHLRAAVDRASGKVTWQVWHEMINFRQKLHVAAVQYRSGGALQAGQPARVEKWDEVCQMADTNAPCFTHLRVVFDLPEAAVREIAASWSAGSRTAWPVRFKAEAGDDVTGGLAPAEAAGLVQAVDAWRARTGINARS
jgi:hypothetical protein